MTVLKTMHKFSYLQGRRTKRTNQSHKSHHIISTLVHVIFVLVAVLVVIMHIDKKDDTLVHHVNMLLPSCLFTSSLTTNTSCNNKAGHTNNSNNNFVQAASFISSTPTTHHHHHQEVKPRMLHLVPSQSIRHSSYHNYKPNNIQHTSSSSSRDVIQKNNAFQEIFDEEAGDTIIIQSSDNNNNTHVNSVANVNVTTNKANLLNSNNTITKKSSNNNYNVTTTTTSIKQSKNKIKNYTNNHQNDNNNNKIQRFKYNGNLPDIYWRAIPMDHLRLHPNYKPLPHPSTITILHSLEDVRNFRQDSWQWDLLHSGRCTTSQASQALGLLEPNVAKLLGIPRSLQKGSMGAYRRLGQMALRTLEEMNDVLCCHYDDNSRDDNNDNDIDDTCSYNNSDMEVDVEVDFDDNDDYEKFEAKFRVLNFNDIHYNNNDEKKKKKDNNKKQHNHHQHQNSRIWRRVPRTRYPFAARYLLQITDDQLVSRRKQTKQYMSTLSSPMRIRMNWGNSQEATAILTALNYFYSIDRGVKIKEVGMCGAGLKYNSTKIGSTQCSNLLLGASPDAVIEYSNGTLEVLEVKNHCPFVPARKYKETEMTNKPTETAMANYRIREMPMIASVPPAYIPQLMMEMMCLGDECKSAVMCRQTATNGAMLIRLRRDDEWIEEMIYWLEKFVNEYVNESQPPPQNFFWFDENQNVSKRYQDFIKRTKELSEEVELVQCIPHSSIQRVVGSNGVRLPLFLD